MPVSHLELDEIWTFVHKKQRRALYGDSKAVGDAFCFVAIDRDSRLVVACHLDKRADQNTSHFLKKVRDAPSGEYQISTKAFPSYQPAIGLWLKDRASYGRTVKALRPGLVEAALGQPDLAEALPMSVGRGLLHVRQVDDLPAQARKLVEQRLLDVVALVQLDVLRRFA